MFFPIEAILSVWISLFGFAVCVDVRPQYRKEGAAYQGSTLCNCDPSPVFAEQSSRVAVSKHLYRFVAEGDNPKVVPKRLARCVLNASMGRVDATLQMILMPNLNHDGCILHHLNSALLCAALSKRSGSDSPSVFLRRLERVIPLAMLLRSCALSGVSYDGVIRSMRFESFSLVGFLREFRTTLVGFSRGGKHMDLRQVYSSTQDLNCDRDESNENYLQQAVGQRGVSPRIYCMYPAAYPVERARIELIGRTFAKHCDFSVFFVAPSRHSEQRASWQLDPEHGGHDVVNLASMFPESLLKPDVEAFMRVEAIDDASRKRLSSEANLIVKVILMILVTSEWYLDKADLFCRLDLDSAFVPENLRAFVRATGSHWMAEKVYIGALNYKLKYRFGVYPNGGAGICLTRIAVEAFAQQVRSNTFRLVHSQANRCEFQNGFNDDVVLAQCFRLANITWHPDLEDNLGRAYATSWVLPCREHMSADVLAAADMGLPLWLGRQEHLMAVMSADGVFGKSGWFSQLHRYALCEPQELAKIGPNYWLSPFAFGFHGYKDIHAQQNAYDVIYSGARCSWTLGYKHHVIMV